MSDILLPNDQSSGGGFKETVGRVAATFKRSKTADEPPSEDYANLPSIHDRRSSTFLLREQTGSEMSFDYQGKPIATKEKPNNFTNEVVKDFADDLKGVLNRLMDIQNRTPDVFDRLVNDPLSWPYRDLLAKYTREKEGSAAAGNVKMEFDEAGLDAYLRTREGFEKSYQLRAMKDREMATMAAEFLVSNFPLAAPETIENQDVNIGQGGKLRRISRKVNHFMREPLRNQERRAPVNLPIIGTINTRLNALGAVGALSEALGAAGFFLGGGPFGVAAGVLASPAIAAIARSLRRGENINLEQAVVAFQIAENADPIRREWAREVFNIDPHNLEVDGNGNVIVRGGIQADRYLASPAKNNETLRDILVREELQLRKAQELMGIRRDTRLGLDLWGLTPGQEQFAQNDMPFEIRVQTQVKRELLDNADEPCMIQTSPGEWADNPAFDWQNTDRIVAWNLRETIARNLLCLDMNQDFQDITEWGADHNKDVKDIIASARTAVTSEIARTKEAIGREIGNWKSETGNPSSGGNLEVDSKEIQRLAGVLAAFQTEYEKIASAEQARTREADRVRDAAGNPIAAPATEIARILRLQAGTVNNIQVDGIEIRPIFRRQRALDAAIEVDVAAWRGRNPLRNRPGAPPLAPQAPAGPNAQDAAVQAAHMTSLAEYQKRAAAHDKAVTDYETYLTNYEVRQEAERTRLRGLDLFKNEQTKINADITKLEGIQTNLNNRNTEINTAQEDLRDRSKDFARNTEQALNQMQAAEGTVRGWNGTGGADLSANALETMPEEDLLARINEVYEADNTRGWPREANGEAANRQLLIQAMVEARLPSSDDFVLARSSVFGISEYDLLVQDAPRIEELMIERRNASGSPAPTDAEIQILAGQLGTLAQERNGERQRVLQELSEDRQRRRTQQLRELTRITEDETNGVAAPELTVIEKAITNLDTINSGIIDMSDANLVEFLSPDLASTRPGEFLDFEQDIPIAFLRIQELLFKYHEDIAARYENARGREAALQRDSNVLDQDTLRDLMIDEPAFSMLFRGLPAGVPGITPFLPPATFAEAAGMLQDAFQAREITKAQLARFLSQNVVYDHLVRRASGI